MAELSGGTTPAASITGLTQGAVLVGSSGGGVAQVAGVALGQVLISQGTTTAPAYSGSPAFPTWQSLVVDGASAVAHIIDGPAFANATSKLVSARNNAVEKAYVGFNGRLAAGPGGLSAARADTTSPSGSDATFVYNSAGIWTSSVPLAASSFCNPAGGGTDIGLSFGASQMTYKNFAGSFNGHTFTIGNNSGTLIGFVINGGTHTTQAASTEQVEVKLALNQTKTWNTGNFAKQRQARVLAPTLAANAASVITEAGTWCIDRAPQAGASMTISNGYALWVEADRARFDGQWSYPAAQTQATVGALGAAAALPALPTGYFKFDIDGVTFVTPYYAAA